MENESVIMEEVEPPGQGNVPSANLFFTQSNNTARTTGRLFSVTSQGNINLSNHSETFLAKHFPSARREDWQNWKWQISHAVTTFEELKHFIDLTEEEEKVFSMSTDHLPLAITPYYLSLVDRKDFLNPLRRSVVPTIHERTQWPGEKEDPLNEDEDSPVPGLVHRYPDRVLFLVTDFCSTYCRYCTRSRLVGKNGRHCSPAKRWARALDYIAKRPEIRDVLLSGGDPLTLGDGMLERLLSELRRIPHVEIVRIGTKAPVVLPQRITTSLVRTLRRYHPLWMSIHFTHPDEITEEVKTACRRLADAGIPLLSQTVLLKGINDNAETLRRLFHELVKMRVRPYYLYQCDPILGSGHFRTSVAKGIDIMKRLRGYTSGFAVPLYVIDAPGGGGKIPIMPDYQMGHEGNDLLMKNYEGNVFRYHDEPVITTDAALRACTGKE